MSKIVRSNYDRDTGTYVKVVLESIADFDETLEALYVGEKLSESANYSSQRVEGKIPVKGIIYTDLQPDKGFVDRYTSKTRPVYIDETYNEYLRKMIQLDRVNVEWIRQIIDGSSEQDKVLERGHDYVIVRDWQFDVTYEDPYSSADENSQKSLYEKKMIFNKEKLHILAIPSDPNVVIRSIRGIAPEHIPMLQNMKERALTICETMFDMDRNEVKVFFHYPPTSYHLHIHFVWLGMNDSSVNFEKAFDFDAVIRNITLDRNYYQGTMRYVSST